MWRELFSFTLIQRHGTLLFFVSLKHFSILALPSRRGTARASELLGWSNHLPGCKTRTQLPLAPRKSAQGKTSIPRSHQHQWRWGDWCYADVLRLTGSHSLSLVGTIIRHRIQGASLVVQWLRLCTGAWVHSLVMEPDPTCHNAVIGSVQLLSCVWLFATLRTAARQASLSIPNSRSLLKLMSIELEMPSNHLISQRSHTHK